MFGYNNSNANVIGHFNPEWENDLGVIYVLDYTNPEVQKYITHVFKTLRGYGFEYFKIDFLTCGIRDGIRYDNNMTRLEVYRMSLQLIRDAIGPDAFLLGCGAPLAPSIGLVDGCRISGDIKELWSGNVVEYFCSGMFCSIPSIKNSLLGNMRRNFIHNTWWLNDPDCLLVRVDERFNLYETHTQLSVLGMTGGIMLLSDDLPKLKRERLDLVNKVLPVSNILKGLPNSYTQSTYPNVFYCKGMAQQLGDADIYAFVNWYDDEQIINLFSWLKTIGVNDESLDINDYFLWDFWNECPIVNYKDVKFHSHETIVVLSTKHGGNDGAFLVGNSINMMGQSDRRIQGTYDDEKKMMEIFISDVESKKGKLWIVADYNQQQEDEDIIKVDNGEICSINEYRTFNGKKRILIEIFTEYNSMQKVLDSKMWTVKLYFGNRKETMHRNKEVKSLRTFGGGVASIAERTLNNVSPSTIFPMNLLSNEDEIELDDEVHF